MDILATSMLCEVQILPILKIKEYFINTKVEKN